MLWLFGKVCLDVLLHSRLWQWCLWFLIRSWKRFSINSMMKKAPEILFFPPNSLDLDFEFIFKNKQHWSEICKFIISLNKKFYFFSKSNIKRKSFIYNKIFMIKYITLKIKNQFFSIFLYISVEIFLNGFQAFSSSSL